MGTVQRFYSNNAVAGTLGGTGVTIGATSMWLSSTPSGYPSQFPFTLWLEPGTASQEAVSVTAGAGTAATPWTIQRGFDNTVARAHSAGATVAHELSAFDVATSRTHEAQDSTTTLPHGLPISAWAGSAFGTIQETIMANSTGSVVTFSAIPQTYSHLMVVIQGRGTSSTSNSIETQVTINGNTNNKYSYMTIQAFDTQPAGNNQPAALFSNSQAAWNAFIQLPGSNLGSSVNAGGGFAILPNYANSAFNKMFYSIGGWGNGTDVNITCQIRTGYYNPSGQNSINSLSIAASQGNFQSGSFFGLYGLG